MQNIEKIYHELILSISLYTISPQPRSTIICDSSTTSQQ